MAPTDSRNHMQNLWPDNFQELQRYCTKASNGYLRKAYTKWKRSLHFFFTQSEWTQAVISAPFLSFIQYAHSTAMKEVNSEKGCVIQLVLSVP